MTARKGKLPTTHPKKGKLVKKSTLDKRAGNKPPTPVIGNNFWEKRATHGRHKIFDSPLAMWEAFVEYCEYTASRVWIKEDWVGKDAVKVERKSSPPFTLGGMALFFGVSLHWWGEFKKAKHEGFLDVMAEIEQTIYLQKFEGASVGAFNANIISRDLGLTDKVENIIMEQPLFLDVPASENETPTTPEAK